MPLRNPTPGSLSTAKLVPYLAATDNRRDPVEQTTARV
jgi:hypothetical protein